MGSWCPRHCAVGWCPGHAGHLLYARTAAPTATVGLAAVPVWGPNHHRKVTEEAVAVTVRVGCEEGQLLSALWGMDVPGVFCKA